MRTATLSFIAPFLLLTGCESSTEPASEAPVEVAIHRIPVVVHVLHKGEPEGQGPNLTTERIERQIEILNEDFRRVPGSPGENDHPDGADARIEFVLARRTPDGAPTNGIHRVDTTQIEITVPPNDLFRHFAAYAYWDHTRYLNVWSLPFGADSIDVFLAQATGPRTDLPGSDLLLAGEPEQPEGVLINHWHLGESTDSAEHGMGRTLTHEIGHYLGLLHLWGAGDCSNNDYCDDTPPVSGPSNDCASDRDDCDGDPAMLNNYMDWTSDACMNMFTRDQVARMRYVLETSPDRIALRNSPALSDPPAAGTAMSPRGARCWVPRSSPRDRSLAARSAARS